MSQEFIQEFIGKVCKISLIGTAEVIGEIIALENNWLKVLDNISKNDRVQILNCDMIIGIKIMPEKYQK